MSKVLDKAFLESVFPPERTEAFFDALFGGAEEGAYDIVLVCRSEGEGKAELAFELHQRPGKCLACNLTYGLPQVFQRHPILNVAGGPCRGGKTGLARRQGPLVAGSYRGSQPQPARHPPVSGKDCGLIPGPGIFPLDSPAIF